ncbi:hypothetical protein LIA77_00430 [Sarocladium implicatum]|nr:hypothetical protein LIA77_00430 [Sarocladium implicatum]
MHPGPCSTHADAKDMTTSVTDWFVSGLILYSIRNDILRCTAAVDSGEADQFKPRHWAILQYDRSFHAASKLSRDSDTQVVMLAILANAAKMTSNCATRTLQMQRDILTERSIRCIEH